MVVDLRSQFGWRNKPGFWGLITASLKHTHTHSTFQDSVVSPQGAAVVEHVELAPSRGVPVKLLLHDCRPVRDDNTGK